MTEDLIAKAVIGVSIEVHEAFGPGLLESAYRERFTIKSERLVLKLKKKNRCH
jgi:hypothetical protein